MISTSVIGVQSKIIQFNSGTGSHFNKLSCSVQKRLFPEAIFFDEY